MTATLACRRNCRGWGFAAGLASVLSGIASAFAGGPIVDAKGWESPYAVGNLVPSPPAAGQQGWKKSSVGTGLGAANVQSSVKLTGAQALEVTRGTGSYDRWAVPNLTGFPTGRFVLITWDMRIEQAGGGAEALGPIFGVEAYASNSNPLSLLGMFGADASTGELIYQEPNDGFYTAPGATISFGAWNTYRILLDYAQQQFRMYLNTSFIAAGEFVDKPTGNFSTISDADILAGAAGSDPASMALTGTAYIDNFFVRDGIAGDFDQDGDIDGQDLAKWKSDFNVNANSNSDGDADSDGADLLIWQQNLGSFDYTPAAAAVTATPEPAAALLAFVGAGTLIWRRTRRD